MPDGSLIGIGFGLIAALCLAVQSLAVRLGTKTHHLTELITVMFAVNLLLLIPVTLITSYPANSIPLEALVAFSIAGLIGSLAARICYFIGIMRLGASRTEPLKALLPLFAVGTAVLVLDERVTVGLLLGVVLLVIGGIAVTLETRASPVTPTGRSLWIAVSFPLLAAIFLGIDPVFTKLGLATGTSPLVGVTIRILAAAGGFGLYLGWRTVRTRQFVIPSPTRWLVTASLANTLYLMAYYAALTRAPVSVITPILGLSTLFVIGGAAVFLQHEEHITWRLGAGALIVVFGVLLVLQA